MKIFEPVGAPSSDKMVHKREVPKMTPGRAALVELIQRYLKGLMDPTVSLLEVHKLMYFMQESGESLRLKFQEATYGPYAENLRHVLHAIEGHMIAGYSDGGDIPDKQISLVPGAVEEAKAFLESHEKTQERFYRVSQLVSGFESSFGLELLSTVHWVAKNSSEKTTDSVINKVHSWSERKRQFTPRQIKIALNVLENQGWLNN
ncbi:hypothetical protein LLS47_03580 [Rouxiella badensis]|uniref:hypothetical protein n=1 Tax=Rouxiella badensis TaxID=1646377 RepID=UPI001D14E6AC|nr:hypothetical protein [Rouxiella badensis]MCC3732021.1 hypothetical protein [Rouxiella badensis]MCC3757410.1 hypothetical protein [Rouxiella badensis]